jgi:hypothetical protein
VKRLWVRSLLVLLVVTGGLLLVVGALLWLGVSWKYSLPSENRAGEQFRNHRADYIRIVALLRMSGRAAAEIDREYQNLIEKAGAKNVIVREDGSIEFQLWGFGCTICSDSYMGVRYYPKDHSPTAGWTQTLVTSLDSKNLPHEKGSIATGLYVVPLEPEWFIYRFEYRE